MVIFCIVFSAVTPILFLVTAVGEEVQALLESPRLGCLLQLMGQDKPRAVNRWLTGHLLLSNQLMNLRLDKIYLNVRNQSKSSNRTTSCSKCVPAFESRDFAWS